MELKIAVTLLLVAALVLPTLYVIRRRQGGGTDRHSRECGNPASVFSQREEEGGPPLSRG
jgi:hypothetical protein